MQLELEQQEVLDIINVLGKLPTEANSYPLRQKIIAQYEIAFGPSNDATPNSTPAE